VSGQCGSPQRDGCALQGRRAERDQATGLGGWMGAGPEQASRPRRFLARGAPGAPAGTIPITAQQNPLPSGAGHES
jgi:hypothetical protein